MIKDFLGGNKKMLVEEEKMQKVELELVAIGKIKRIEILKEDLEEIINNLNQNNSDIQIFHKFTKLSEEVFDLKKRQ